MGMNKLAAVSLFLFTACQAGTSDAPTKDDVRNQGKADDGHDWCEELGWYGDGVCDDFCLKQDPDCATDDRAPELPDPKVVHQSKVSMLDGLRQAEKTGPVIEAKFEPDDSGNLSLSTYPIGKPLSVYPTDNVLQELAGDPTASPWAPSLEQFHDFEHLATSTRDQTLRNLSNLSIVDAVAELDGYSTVYWVVPTIQEGRAGYGVWSLVGDGDDEHPEFDFVDGQGSHKKQIVDLGTGPGSSATDPRVPELGDDYTIMRTAQVQMKTAVAQLQAKYGGIVEAKYEIGDDGKLSLSIYTTQKGNAVDAKNNTFFELAGDPTGTTYTPDEQKFDVPDEEHITKASRDLTILQASRLTVADAIVAAESKISHGIVFWAIPTIRGTRGGIGVYVLAPDNTVHYFFMS
jgi:hypothetical protein